MENYPNASYEHLLHGYESEPERHVKRWQSPTTSHCTRIGAILLVLSVLGNLIMLAVFDHARILNVKGSLEQASGFHLYSPAEVAVVPKLVKFESSIFDGVTPYQGPPNAVNERLWAELYAGELTHISREEALQMPNKTMPEAPYAGSGYLITLSVFHNLHCLDSIRRAIYFFADAKWDAYDNPYTQEEDVFTVLEESGGFDSTGIVHLDHCIDVLRQSLMCDSDIAPFVFQFSEKWNEVRTMGKTVHQCRDFWKIKEWQQEHRATFHGFGDGEPVGKCLDNDPWQCLYN